VSEAARVTPGVAVSDSGVTWKVGADGVAEILFDTPGGKVNLINPQTLAALEEAVAFLRRREGVRGVLLASAKPGIFIAGADVKLIASVRSPKEGLGKSMGGQMVFNELAALPFPTVAVISGACLGGGLELALACTARIAADAEEVQIGLPEVRLGIIPGWGGTQRLPRLIGLPAALDLILTGRALAAREALKLGLVDALAAPERLLAEARRHVARLGEAKPRASRSLGDISSRLSGLQRLILRAPARGIVLARARATTRALTSGHYPAPLAAIDAVGRGLARGMDEGLKLEAEHVGDLVVGEVSRGLVRLFLASRGMDGEGAAGPERAVRSVGILGAGVMGGAIAAVAASKGIPVRLRDVGREPLERGLAHAHAILSGRGRRRKPEAWTLSRFMMIAPTMTLHGFSSTDLVIEAVVEDLEVKRRALAEIERSVPEGCILASNTSSLSIDAIASGLARPERFVGLHFFNPVDRMPLVEVVRGRRSGEPAVAAARAFARKLGKTPVVVGDAPGFVVNRLLMPYLAEALRAAAAGIEIETIDRDLVRFGMPMGPLALLDQIGIDVAAKVARILADAFGERLPSPAGLEAVAQAGWLGVKSGKGFYTHGGGRPRPNSEAVALLRSIAPAAAAGGRPGAGRVGSAEPLVQRLLYPVINEAARALSEGVVDGPETIDVAMVFGAGFPPFLGGPLRWADREGVAAVAGTLRRFASEGDAHAAPSEALEKVAAGTGRFYTA
jgi:3-hydroxyacyl-CoA dehydrogenase / enoyl-CoA hydratase / 3-hydroxybutyryl-CoA epimerase